MFPTYERNIMALIFPLVPIIYSALGAAGAKASGAFASNNVKAAAAAQAELERHNREVESQLEAGSGVISDHLGKALFIGNS